MGFTHLDEQGRVSMVDVGGKDVTRRTARARGTISMSRETFDAIMEDRVKKGNVLVTAKIAAIMAAKNTSNTIPLCHPLPIDHIAVDFHPREESSSIEVSAEVSVTAKTGVEMEALHAASIALLTIYDMCKAIDKSMVIEGLCLVEKSGGRSGHYVRPEGE
ncbi:MAG TPA: cyclic pyranopterin monophosphate synthase MoaC [Deltaproteobacteria bacterium]|nr:cyclic pyranopterin monophosphate synthase MoaC [Deltaproteobacteria bacterium]HQJ08779.1 cyclic pyranopterin monophosphate synthase MoaC [Deltaproteobacteria bacterium]